jgi:hypothetical protein
LGLQSARELKQNQKDLLVPSSSHASTIEEPRSGVLALTVLCVSGRGDAYGHPLSPWRPPDRRLKWATATAPEVSQGPFL